MVGTFFSALGLFSMARFGGIPVPSTRIHTVLWLVVFVVQVVEYILVFFSAIMIILAYVHVRYFHGACMYKAWEWLYVADVAFFATMFALPVINQSLLILFIYAYVISTCLKVWRATSWRATSSISYIPIPSLKRTKDREYELLSEEPSVEETFKRELVRTDQPWPIASWHVRIAFLGLALSSVISVLFGGWLVSICFYPDAFAMVIIIKLTFAFVRWVEDDLAKGKEKANDDGSQTNEPRIRMFTGWFRDISFYLSPDTYLHGFQVAYFFRYARIELDGAYRKKIVGDLDSMGGGDAGFVNVLSGFTIFPTCIALAPATCYGVWIILPVVMGSLPISEAVVLVQLYYEQMGETYATVINELINFEFKWNWPEWFNLVAFWEFWHDPAEKLYEAMDFVINAIAFLSFDLDRLIEGSRALLCLNSALAFSKSFAVLIWACWIRAIWSIGYVLRNDPELKGFPSHVLFGDCVPGKAQMERAARVRAVKTGGFQVHELKRKGHTAAECKEAGYEARDLKVPNGFGLKELLDAPYSLKDIRQAGVTAADLVSQGVPALQIYEAGYTIPDLMQAFEHDLGVLRVDCQIPPRKMREAGCKADRMKSAGYSAKECKGVFDVREIIDGFGLKELLDAPYSLKDLRQAGVTAADLVSQGVPALQIYEAGYTIPDLMQAFEHDLEVLRVDCQIPPRVMREAGCKADRMKSAGYSAKECKGVFDVREIIDAYGNQILEGDLFELSELFVADIPRDTLQAIQKPWLLGLGKTLKWSDKDLDGAGYPPRMVHVEGGIDTSNDQ
jgi:hypothetical protein